MLRDDSWLVGNLDVTVICESPKIGTRTTEMRSLLAELTGLAPGEVSVKGKSNEGMGWIGRREGIAVHAVALLFRETEGALPFADPRPAEDSPRPA